MDSSKNSENNELVRYVCSHCGGWREADPIKLAVSLSQGAEQGSEFHNEIQEAKKTEAPFMLRHIRSYGAIIKGVYSDDTEWNKLDPQKQEN